LHGSIPVVKKTSPLGLRNPKENDQRESEPVFWWNPPRGNRPICTRQQSERGRLGDGLMEPGYRPGYCYPEGKALNAAGAALSALSRMISRNAQG